MFDTLLAVLSPHHCYSCSKKGNILCESCIYNIVNESLAECFACHLPAVREVCAQCRSKLPFQEVYIAGERKLELEKLLNDYKFNRVYAAYLSLAAILDGITPLLPKNAVVVPIPTITKHIRVRGYDHTKLIAKSFAKKRNLSCSQVLERKTNTVQLGSNAAMRRQQARQAYRCRAKLNEDRLYILIDDIATTGATLIEAAKCLQGAGAKNIIVLAIARQPL